MRIGPENGFKVFKLREIKFPPCSLHNVSVMIKQKNSCNGTDKFAV
jgi:hypothetical protein